jgi:hypothetical protein
MMMIVGAFATSGAMTTSLVVNVDVDEDDDDGGIVEQMGGGAIGGWAAKMRGGVQGE